MIPRSAALRARHARALIRAPKLSIISFQVYMEGGGTVEFIRDVRNHARAPGAGAKRVDHKGLHKTSSVDLRELAAAAAQYSKLDGTPKKKNSKVTLYRASRYRLADGVRHLMVLLTM